MLACTTELLRVEQYGQVAPTMLAGLADVVGGDSACLTHLDLVSQQQVAIRWPSVVSDSRMIGAYPTVGHTHPLRAPLRTLARKPPASLEPIRISDVLAPRAWRQTPFHREAMPDATDQICLPMALHGAVVHAVTLTRDAGTFTDAQAAVLRACGPHLRAVLRRSSPVSEYAFQLARNPDGCRSPQPLVSRRGPRTAPTRRTETPPLNRTRSCRTGSGRCWPLSPKV